MESEPIFISDQKLQELKFKVKERHTDKLSQTDIHFISFAIEPIFSQNEGQGQIPNLKISAKDIACLKTDFNKDQIAVAEAFAEGDEFVLRVQTLKKTNVQNKLAIQIEAVFDLNSISGQASQLSQTESINVI